MVTIKVIFRKIRLYEKPKKIDSQPPNCLACVHDYCHTPGDEAKNANKYKKDVRKAGLLSPRGFQSSPTGTHTLQKLHPDIFGYGLPMEPAFPLPSFSTHHNTPNTTVMQTTFPIIRYALQRRGNAQRHTPKNTIIRLTERSSLPDTNSNFEG